MLVLPRAVGYMTTFVFHRWSALTSRLNRLRGKPNKLVHLSAISMAYSLSLSTAILPLTSFLGPPLIIRERQCCVVDIKNAKVVCPFLLLLLWEISAFTPFFPRRKSIGSQLSWARRRAKVSIYLCNYFACSTNIARAFVELDTTHNKYHPMSENMWRFRPLIFHFY